MERHGADIGDAIRELGLEEVDGRRPVDGRQLDLGAAVRTAASAGIRDIVIIDQTPKMLNSDDWPYGFYDYDASNATTLLRGRHPRSRPALAGLEGSRARRAAAARAWT